ncbi:MAG: hypothetical protein UT41_C0001G0163 [Candidatus Wolfebacteria bacterium GW2011_GWC2_39_22]|uniref:Nudix hydrolase domain-containing protein n=1 Tax=Candidatus Wolfebacteria bacterium GW2011_GWC2_39_22 TaxID=1619013 RepID=A0A0G0N8Z5_9BACT|nr:MAG: hypothetical protein UT41_C0001G0163 [Candidatus Wolfebacteria bacterium GW2011_GWC2_39_22]HBI25822.1 hypothetical protein [Candidatus Wolfebacteria bacterium]
MSLRHAAAIIIRDQKVLLIKRSDQEDSEPNKWCAPNETLKEGERPADGVVRGVKEELAMRFTIEKQLLDHAYQEHTTFVFVGTADGDIVPALDEVSEYGWFSYGDAKQLVFAYDYDKVIENLHTLGLIEN